MALITCRECGNEVSSNAETCPKCGARVKPKSNTAWKVLGIAVGVPFALFVGFAIKGANDPVLQEMQDDRRTLDLCLRDMNDPLRSAAHREAARFMCEGMRDSFVKKYRREP